MKELLNWTFRNIVFPLTPFFIGALIRCAHSNKIALELFNESELALSMGLLCILMIRYTNEMPDKVLGANISYTLMIFTLAFIVLFALASFIHINIEATTVQQIKAITEYLNEKNDIRNPADIYLPNKHAFFPILENLRWGIFILTLITIPTVILLQQKYKLQDG